MAVKASLPVVLVFITTARAAANFNVLMIAVDDLRPQLACTDVPGTIRPRMQTPNICQLAKNSLVLQRSNVAMATCSPSRTALLTSRRSGSNHVWDLVSYFRNVTGSFTTLPQYFKEHGYTTAGMGKIFHPGTASGGGHAADCPLCKGSDDVGYSWTNETYFHGTDPFPDPKQNSWLAVNKSFTDEHPLQDTQVAAKATETLHQLAQANEPFFLAVGFHKPHLPFVFPEEFLNYYPEDEISLPDNAYAPWNMPTIAWQNYGETRSYADVAALNATGAINTTLPDYKVKQLRRAYYSAVSYTDSNVGKVLDALDKEGLAETTVVAFWGDHGWQLGEHGQWDKHTNFDLATHAPVMFRLPGVTDNGRGVESEQLTEHIDIFPTLVDFAFKGSLAVPACAKGQAATTITCTEGLSLRPLLSSPDTPVKSASYSVFSRGIPHNEKNDKQGAVLDGKGVDGASVSNCLLNQCAMGYSMLTTMYGSTYRYTEWVHFTGPGGGFSPNWSTSYGTELYNHTADGGAENRNIFSLVDGTDLASQLASLLHSAYE